MKKQAPILLFALAAVNAYASGILHDLGVFSRDTFHVGATISLCLALAALWQVFLNTEPSNN